MQYLCDARCTITKRRALECHIKPINWRTKAAGYRCTRCKRVIDGYIDPVTWRQDYMPKSRTYNEAESLFYEANTRGEA